MERTVYKVQGSLSATLLDEKTVIDYMRRNLPENTVIPREQQLADIASWLENGPRTGQSFEIETQKNTITITKAFKPRIIKP